MVGCVFFFFVLEGFFFVVLCKRQKEKKGALVRFFFFCDVCGDKLLSVVEETQTSGLIKKNPPFLLAFLAPFLVFFFFDH